MLAFALPPAALSLPCGLAYAGLRWPIHCSGTRLRGPRRVGRGQEQATENLDALAMLPDRPCRRYCTAVLVNSSSFDHFSSLNPSCPPPKISGRPDAIPPLILTTYYYSRITRICLDTAKYNPKFANNWSHSIEHCIIGSFAHFTNCPSIAGHWCGAKEKERGTELWTRNRHI